MRMRVEAAAALIGAEIRGAAGATLLGAEVDSRRVRPGDLFIALPGQRQDGHDFVAEALKKCTAALVRRDFDLEEIPAGRALVRVEDPTQAYHALAAAQRSQQGWKVLTLTGSVGKTTTKDMLQTLLGGNFRTGASRGNRNSTLGLPAEILSQEDDLEVFIAEAGMNHAGELKILGEITRPDFLLYTRIAPVHTAFFPTMEALVEAKKELLPFLRPGGTLILNADDPVQQSFVEGCRGEILFYGLDRGEIHFEAAGDFGLEGIRGRLHIGSTAAPIELALAGRHQLMNFLAAAAGASALGMGIAEIADAAGKLRASVHRGEILHPADDILLLDDSYNASPVAMEANLHLLAASRGRRIAVLGDMLELGAESSEAHRNIGALAAASADLLFCVGGEGAAEILEGARTAGMAPGRSFLAADTGEAAALLDSEMRAGDIILVKASRGVGLESLVETLCGKGE